MTTFAWKGIEAGQHASGAIDMPSLEEAKQLLTSQGIVLTAIEQEVQDEQALDKKPYSARRIKKKEIMIFTKKFATMVEAGLPILKTLRMLEDQATNIHFKKVVAAIKEDVEAGSTLSNAFSKHEKVFDVIYINLLRAGEESGKLTTFLKRLVIQIEKSEKIRRKVKGALTYPIILLSVAVIVIAIMLIKVVPIFEKMFSSMGHSLPGPTQMIISISDFLRNPSQGGVVIGILIVLFVIARHLVKNNYNVRCKYHELLLRIPVLGDVIRMSILSKIAMVEGNLSAAGVSVLESIDIISDTISNVIFKEALADVRQGVSEGKPLSELYAQHEVFPPTFAQMIAVGEETGNMDDMFTALALYYEEEFDMVVDRLTELLEPFMIVFMGTTVGFIIIAMYMPIFQIGSAVGG